MSLCSLKMSYAHAGKAARCAKKGVQRRTEALLDPGRILSSLRTSGREKHNVVPPRGYWKTLNIRYGGLSNRIATYPGCR